MIPREKVLVVDDDPNLLSALKRQFRKQLNLTTAQSGGDGLSALNFDGPFAVVVSDMKMPNMDGVEFLSRVHQQSPDTVRIMLTGNADLQTAVEAVNKGAIFRFLTKPCNTDLLYQTIAAGIDQYRLYNAEKELLGKTLKGAVNLLTDVLGLVSPKVFSRCSRIRRYMHGMVETLNLRDAWSFELAAMFSMLGTITLPGELVEKAISGAPLSDAEQKSFDAHPEIAARLVQRVPRLETVANMVQLQQANKDLPSLGEKLINADKAILGGHMLKVIMAYDVLTIRGESHDAVIAMLRGEHESYDPGIVEALDSSIRGQRSVQIVTLPLADVKPGMIIDQDLHTPQGGLLVAKGQEVSESLYYRLQNLESNKLLAEDSLRVVKRV